MTDFRALCAELLDALEGYIEYAPVINVVVEDEQQLVANARAALAQPEPQGVSDEELLELADDCDLDRFDGERSYPDGVVVKEGYWEAWDHQLLTFARAVLARWGRPAIEPVPVSERLPEVGDKNEEGEVWVEEPGGSYSLADTGDYHWEPHRYVLRDIQELDHRHNHRWVPHWALPVPQQQEAE
jgi:hypothetical protein